VPTHPDCVGKRNFQAESSSGPPVSGWPVVPPIGRGSREATIDCTCGVVDDRRNHGMERADEHARPVDVVPERKAAATAKGSCRQRCRLLRRFSSELVGSCGRRRPQCERHRDADNSSRGSSWSSYPSAPRFAAETVSTCMSRRRAVKPPGVFHSHRGRAVLGEVLAAERVDEFPRKLESCSW